jgi:hypothetical protein
MQLQKKKIENKIKFEGKKSLTAKKKKLFELFLFYLSFALARSNKMEMSL